MPNRDVRDSTQHERLDPWLSSLAERSTTLAEVFVGLMLLHIVVDVLLDATLDLSIEGTGESVAYWYMVGTAFLPVAMLQQRREHLAADFLSDRLPPMLKRLSTRLSSLLCLVFYLLIVCYAAPDAVSATAAGERIELTDRFLYIWPMKWLLVLAYSLCALIALSQFLGNSEPVEPTNDRAIDS